VLRSGVAPHRESLCRVECLGSEATTAGDYQQSWN
jgi:hypothetical protein